MVKLNASLVKKKCLQQQLCKSLTKEIEKNHLKKITHLFLNQQYIDEIDDFSVCKNLKVIYLQWNSIEKLENLNFAVNLTHLYLQHNELVKIENLELLVNLRKLFLGHNNITVVEGLENLTNLAELHIEKQRLGVGERLCFDPRTARTLSACLEYLNISDNKIITLRNIKNFERLITLEANDNLIEDIEDITETVSSLCCLKNLFLQGNPVTKIRRYRENLIANTYSLVMLDDKQITDNTKHFLRKFKTEKLHQSQKKIEMTLSEDITNSLNLPPAFRRSVSRAMFQNIKPKFLFSEISIVGDLQPQIFPPWKSVSTIKGERNDHVLPRPFWKNKFNNSKNQKDCSYKQNFAFS